jgi:hypothetical protein
VLLTVLSILIPSMIEQALEMGSVQGALLQELDETSSPV